MPDYAWRPSGGYRVVYEYANQLFSRGHSVAVVHPRYLPCAPACRPTLRQRLRRCKLIAKAHLYTPVVDWHSINPGVRLLYVPSLHDRYIPDADVLFATAWNTVGPVMNCSEKKGRKAYIIQSYETWMGPKDQVDATWRMPLYKIIIAKWLVDLGNSLKARGCTYIPNGIDHSHYRITQPILPRPHQIVMMCSHFALKGSREGVAALQLAKKQFPDLRVVLFGDSYRPPWVPSWMPFRENPPQQEIVEQFYNPSSIMLSPSWIEGFPLPPIEAACCGCALVATDIGGHREYIEHGVTGLLSPPRDPQALANNLCTLLADDAVRVRLAQTAHNFVQQYTWRRSADLMESFLFKTLDHSAGPFNELM